jgi:hypothetical protein
MNDKLKTFCCALGIAFLAPADAVDHGLHKQRIEAEVHVGNTDLGAAKFELACRGGKGGSLSLSLILMQPAAAKVFPLDDFEGPDGAGESRELAQWAVDTRGAGVTLDSVISGWYGVDGDGFLFSTAAIVGKNAALFPFARRLTAADAQRLRLRVTPARGGEPLQASVLLAGAQAKLAQVAADCLESR